MKVTLVLAVVFYTTMYAEGATYCGCKSTRPCYEKMLKTLQDRDEVPCIEDAAIGASTVTIFLKALQIYCSEVIEVTTPGFTSSGKYLFEVTLYGRKNVTKMKSEETPIIILEAGQLAGTETVGFALFVIEQLVACKEYQPMLENVRWVILPSTNPDGQELNRFLETTWTKNMEQFKDTASYGVDISRNFDSQWGACAASENSHSLTYRGPNPGSEKETVFISDILKKYKRDTKIYVSIKRNGHALLYPHGHSETNTTMASKLSRISGAIASRVNQRAGGIHTFINDSIYNHDGKPYCGNSVDYAYELGIPLSFEMRVFLEDENSIMSLFVPLPRGYETSLRHGYFSGIRELYHVVTNEKKYGRLLK